MTRTPRSSSADATRALLAAARSGDERALDDLFAAAADPLLVFVRLRLGAKLRARVEPADVLQQTFAAALRELDRFEPRGPGSFTAWLCRIAEHQLRALADHHGARKRTPAAGLGEERPSQLAERIAADVTGPQSAARRREESARLEAALGRLDEDEREVLLLRYFQDLSVRDIAAATGRSATAAHRMLGRATSRLGRELGSTESDA